MAQTPHGQRAQGQLRSISQARQSSFLQRSIKHASQRCRCIHPNSLCTCSRLSNKSVPFSQAVAWEPPPMHLITSLAAGAVPVLLVDVKSIQSRHTVSESRHEAVKSAPIKKQHFRHGCLIGLIIRPVTLDSDMDHHPHLICKHQKATLHGWQNGNELVCHIHLDEPFSIPIEDLCVPVAQIDGWRQAISGSYDLKFKISFLNSTDFMDLHPSVFGGCHHVSVTDFAVLHASCSIDPSCAFDAQKLDITCSFHDMGQQPPRAVTRQTCCSLEVGISWRYPTTSIIDISNRKYRKPIDPSPAVPPSSRMVELSYTFKYAGQSNTVHVNGMTCPLCDRKEYGSLDILRFHLRVNHELFKFVVNEITEDEHCVKVQFTVDSTARPPGMMIDSQNCGNPASQEILPCENQKTKHVARQPTTLLNNDVQLLFSSPAVAGTTDTRSGISERSDVLESPPTLTIAQSNRPHVILASSPSTGHQKLDPSSTDKSAKIKGSSEINGPTSANDNLIPAKPVEFRDFVDLAKYQQQGNGKPETPVKKLKLNHHKVLNTPNPRISRIAPPVARKKYPVPRAPPDVVFFRTVSKRPLEEGEMVSESDDDVDESWLKCKHDDALDDFDDVTPIEKDFMKKFNEHFQKEQLSGNRFVADALLRFTKANVRFLRKEGMMQQFALKGAVMVLDGILDEEDVLRCYKIIVGNGNLLNGRKSPPVVQEKGALQPWQSGCVCGKSMTDMHNIICCANETCRNPEQHLDCMGLEKRPFGWQCRVCTSQLRN